MATLIPVSGETRTITPANESAGFTLDELYAAIGTDIVEFVYLDDGRVCVIDEEGKIRPEPKSLNPKATAVCKSRLFPGDYIAGPALICSEKEVR